MQKHFWKPHFTNNIISGRRVIQLQRQLVYEKIVKRKGYIQTMASHTHALFQKHLLEASFYQQYNRWEEREREIELVTEVVVTRQDATGWG